MTDVAALWQRFGDRVDWNAGRAIEMAHPELEAGADVDHEIDRFIAEGRHAWNLWFRMRLSSGVAELSLAARKPESAKYSLERTDRSETGLQKIHPDECREQQPRRMNQPCKRERRKNEDAGEAANDVVIAHEILKNQKKVSVGSTATCRRSPALRRDDSLRNVSTSSIDLSAGTTLKKIVDSPGHARDPSRLPVVPDP
jgi:hypothetical protein